MTARKMIACTLVFLLPCGFVILLTRSVLRSSLGERFLKGTTPMRKPAFLASAVLSVAALVTGCGSGSTQPLTPRSLSLSIRDNPPTGVSVLSFEINVTGASLQPSDASKPAVSLVSSPIDIELTQLETEKALLNGASAPDNSYSSISLTFANPQLTILNQTGQTITMGTQTCVNGQVCEFKPALNQSSVTISSAPFPVTISASAPMSLVVDFDLNSSIQNNLSVTPTVTLAAVPAQASDGEIENIEGVKGQVQGLSAAGFTLQEGTSGQTFTVDVNNNTQYQNFNEAGCAPNNFSCVQVGQIVEVEHLLVMTNGTLVASQVQLDEGVNQEELEGTIVAVNAASNQFQMVVENEEPAVQGVSVGNSVTISINTGALYAVDSDGLSGAIPSGASFASASDLLVGQEVKVRPLIVSSSSTGRTATTDRVKLHMSQFPGTVASLNAPNFAVNNLPGLFTSNGINQVQVVVSSGTEFEGISGGSSLTVGNNVVLRGLLFKTAADPALVAKKVRKR
jgi:Domain of unknown function (DUF5666)/Domain of unknown function (DUF4382)